MKFDYIYLNYLIIDTNIKKSKLSKRCQVSSTVLSQWLNDKKKPGIKKIKIMADYFKVDISDFLMKSDTEKHKKYLNNIYKKKFIGA